MKALIGFECSQEVTKAARELGIETYSNDIQECYGDHPEWHIKCKFEEAIYLEKWDFIGIHPPCTHLAVSGNRWYANTSLRNESIQYTINLWKLVRNKCKKGYMENPVGVLGTADQIIQPYMFGHGEKKATCLWLHNLPKLIPTNIVEGREQNIWKMSPGPERSKNRSKTYTGIAEAIAKQWLYEML